MNQICIENEREIIEVPPELRGLTDDEIIRNSERKDKSLAGKRKNGALRPSKRERLAQKQEKGQKEAESIVAEIFRHNSNANPANLFKKSNFSVRDPRLTREQQKLLDSAFTHRSAGFSKVSSNPFGTDATVAEPVVKPEPRSMISEAPKPASGRVLKASFGTKTGDKPKAVIVSAADLAQQKAEERAKKIRDFFRAKHPEATAMPDGEPIKRPRGRPRKKPLIEP